MSELRRLLEDQERKTGYFQKIAEETGRKRLREIDQLSTLIRKHQEAEEALRESELRFRSLFDFSPQAMALLDFEDGGFLEVNDRFCDLTRYSREELLGTTLAKSDLCSPQDLLTLMEELRGAGKVEGYKIDVRVKDGSNLHILIFGRLIHIDGRTSVVATLVDLTHQQLLESKLMHAQKMEALGTLAGGIAHDFNNLLMAILGNISLAKHSLQDNEQALEQMEKAEKASERARDLAQQLLTFSRGGLPVIRNISVGELLRDTVSFTLRGSRSRFALSVPEGLWPIAADTGQISQVISNIVINADQAMPSGGLIRVAAENVEMEKPDDVGSVQRYVRITITDQGSGISPDIRGKIFDPYFTTKSQGSGLGLATCHSIVRNHHGFIEVRSEPGAGAAFDVYLPAASAEPAPKHPDHAGLRYGSERVLILDDEQEVREVLAKMLAALGYRPDTCADGDAALRLFTEALDTKDPYDLVIMDLTVPGGKGGKETIGPVRALDPRVSAIVSSGYADDPIMADYGAYGFDGVIPKPFTVAALSEVLAAVLAQHRSE